MLYTKVKTEKRNYFQTPSRLPDFYPEAFTACISDSIASFKRLKDFASIFRTFIPDYISRAVTHDILSHKKQSRPYLSRRILSVCFLLTLRFSIHNFLPKRNSIGHQEVSRYYLIYATRYRSLLAETAFHIFPKGDHTEV